MEAKPQHGRRQVGVEGEIVAVSSHAFNPRRSNSPAHVMGMRENRNSKLNDRLHSAKSAVSPKAALKRITF